ncbi:MAG: TonB-dependent receptor [Gammaproteobacteria bacterium]|nr:TonB-dependent receptor [Gammaproteobacteria bacterium]
MSRPILKPLTWSVACALGVALPVVAQDVDEITVTGSYIQRSAGFTPASPVDTFDSTALTAQAPRTVADFLTQLPYSYNTSFTVGRALGSSNGSGSINLRNLGSSATLVLLNNRRTARDPVTVNNVDVNSLVPQIAIERIEILKDGASSIYGSDAVGGVANFITKSNFEGAEVQVQGDLRERGSTADYRASGIFGGGNDNLHFMVAGEYFHRTPFTVETYEFWEKEDFAFNLSGWPARFDIPRRDAAGVLTGSNQRVADPQCGDFAQSTASGSTTRNGITYPTNCVQNVPWGTRANAEENRHMAYGEVTYNFSDKLNFYSEVGFTRVRNALSDTPGAGVRATDVTIPGYAPSNAFRAVNAAGAALYAQSSGLQLPFDKDGDGFNDFLPARDPATGRVIVVGTDPAAMAGGMPVVPFWEDVTIVAGSRQLGLQCNLPGNPQDDYNCRNDKGNQTLYEVDTLRYVLGFDGDITDNWHYDVNYMYAQNDEDDTTFGSAFSTPNLRAALAGYGGGGCLPSSLDPAQAGGVMPGTGSCEFFNVFGSSVTTQPGSLLANNLDLVQYIVAQDWNRYRATVKNYNAVVSGSLWEMAAGEVGVAIGFQSRTESWKADYAGILNAGQSDLQQAFVDKDVSQTVRAIFGEINIPLVDNASFGYAEFNGALRYEDTKGPGLSTTDPKVGILYRTPNDRISLRGTWSTSFLAPSLYERFRENAVFTNSVDDGATANFDNLGRVATIIGGNPNLNPQTSEAFNIGATVEPIDNLTISLDYWHFKFKGQIATETANDITTDVNRMFDPAWVTRDTNAGTVVVNLPGHPLDGQTVGQIVTINTSYINNSSVETAGLDLEVNHVWDLGRYGILQNNLLGTYQLDYNVKSTPTSASVDATNNRNTQLSGGSIAIDLRATLRTNWALGPHSVQSLVRYSDGFHNDNPRANPGFTLITEVGSHTTWDLSYTYTFEDLNLAYLSGMKISAGVQNVFDNSPPWVADGNGTLSSLYDYAGRRFWGRLSFEF